MRRILGLMIAAALLAGCGAKQSDPPKAEATTAPAAPATLRELATARKFSIGAAVAYDQLMKSPDYAATLAREYNLVTPENIMKFRNIHPDRERYNFQPADDLVAFAEKNDMKVHGHTLVWHQSQPDWLQSLGKEELKAALREHIFAVVGRYKGKIAYWDVVNEAIDDRTNGYRETFWHKTIGPEYIELAFRWAHEADPGAKLFYNDYGADSMNAKSQAVYDLVRRLKEAGVPIHGVGLQMHISLNGKPPLDEVNRNMQRLAALGLEVQITEFDVQLQKSTKPMEERLADQAKVYGDYLDICLYNKNCTAFITWGFTDRHTWIPSFTGKDDWPLPFDRDLKPKPAYEAMRKVLGTP